MEAVFRLRLRQTVRGTEGKEGIETFRERRGGEDII
jgi:hypothetical protein